MSFSFDGEGATDTRPADKVSAPGEPNLWARDGEFDGDGTVPTATWFNQVADNLRQAIDGMNVAVSLSGDLLLNAIRASRDAAIAAVTGTADNNHDTLGKLQAVLGGLISSAEKGVADGVATLDPNGIVPEAQLPQKPPLAPTVSSFMPAKIKIKRDAADVTFLFIGDSTGNEADEWISLFAAWLGTTYATHTVKYYLYDSGTEAYGAAVTLSTGSGTNTIHIYNNSISGSSISDRMSTRYAASIGAITPDVIVTNDGINRSGNGASTIHKLFLESLQQILLDKPDTPIAAVLQNPYRDDDGMDSANEALRDVLEDLPGMTAIDVHSRFIEANKPPAWYADSIHPNATGQAVILSEMKRHWNAAADLPKQRAFRPWFVDRGYFNLIPNGDLSAFTGALPDGYTEGGSGIITKDTSIVYPGKPHSVKIASTNAKGLRYWIAGGDLLDSLKGKLLTLAVRLHPTSGGDNSTGRFIIQTDGFGGAASIDYTSANANLSQDGWIWQMITDVLVPHDAGIFRMTFYGSAADGTTYFDELVLYEGNGKPRFMR